MPLIGVRQELERGSLAMIRLTERRQVRLPTYVLLRRGQHYNPTVLDFLRLLKASYDVDVSTLDGETVSMTLP